MGNYKLVLEYDGTDYHGFQRQPELPTIQGVLQRALERVADLASPIYAAGRTDAGVHARGQVVNFHGSLKTSPVRFAAAVNAFLPPDIVVVSCEEVGKDFGARASAVAREYAYYLHLGDYPSPLSRRFTTHLKGDLDHETMNDALNMIIGVHDFSSFCRHDEGKSAVREVKETWALRWGDILTIRVKANAFAWMMMRMLCGSLVEVGRGKWTVDYFGEVLDRADNALSGPALPPHGLVLERVCY
jgi:tRNA pseudouridine38-40 synthase